MNNKIYTLVLSIIISLGLFNKTAKAHPGDSCSSAIHLSTVFHIDSLAGNSARWYSFTDTTTFAKISIKKLPDSLGRIRSISLFSSCGSVIAHISIDSNNQDSISLIDSELTIGHTYYVLIDDSSVSGDSGAKFSLLLNFSPSLAPCVVVNLYQVIDCGVNWASASVPTHGRINPSDPSPANVPSGIGPYTLSVTCPTTLSCNPQLLQAYIIFTVINADNAYTGAFTLHDPLGVAITYTPTPGQTCTLIGSSTSWEYNHSAPYFVPWATRNGLNSIWDEYDNTITYYVPVNTTQICGNYTIDGLPYYDITKVPNPPPPDIHNNPLLPNNYMDCDGVTLLVVYKDQCANYQGTFTLDEAFQHYNTGGYVKNFPFPPAGSSNFDAFFIAADLENNNLYSQLPYVGISPYAPPVNFWNLQQSPFIFAAITNTNDIASSTGDDFDFIAAGDYYQTAPPPAGVCTNLLTVSPTAPSTVVCYGGTVTISANATLGGSPYTYVWAPGGQTTATITVSSAGTYTVTVEDANCCTATASISISANSPILVTATATPTAVCAGSCSTLTSSASGGTSPYVYSWSTGATSTTGTTTSGCPTGTGSTFTVYVTDAAGCTSTSSVVVGVLANCCTPPPTGYILTNYTITTAPPPPPIVGTTTIYAIPGGWDFDYFAIPNQIVINGTLDIMANTEFQCDDIYLAPGAKIIVHTGFTLTILDSHLQDCTDMWDKIEVQNGANIIINGSLIEDAQIAVLCDNGPLIGDISKFRFTASIFNKNNISLQVMPYPFPHSGYVGHCTFSCDQSSGITCAGFLNYAVNTAFPVPLDAPDGPDRSSYGIIINAVNAITIGDYLVPSNTNIFEDIDEGIYAKLSNVNVFNNSFYNMTEIIPAYIGTISNNLGVPLAGVYARGRVSGRGSYTLNVGFSPSNVGYPCSFKQCDYGVWARDTINANVIKNLINGFPVGYAGPIPYSRGIYFSNDRYGQLDHAEGNTINANWVGVDNFWNLNSTVHVDENNISSNLNWTNTFGVRINEPFWNTAYYDIDPTNVIKGVSNGVAGVNVYRAYIGYNDINITGVGIDNEGIVLKNSGYSLINENVVNYSPTLFQTDGIRITVSGLHNEQITCNTTGGTPAGTGPFNGIFIGGNQVPISIRTNTMNIPAPAAITYGLYLKATAAQGFIGNQGNPFTGVTVDNYYSNFANTSGAPWSTGASRATPPFSQFYVNSPVGTLTNPNTVLNNGGVNAVLFNIITGTSNNNCHPPRVLSRFLVPEKEEAFSLMSSTTPYAGFIETARWEDHFSIYQYLNDVDTTNLIDSSNDIKNYVDSARYANIGAIDSINKLLGDTNGATMNEIMLAQRFNSSLQNPDTAETELQLYYSILTSLYATGASVPQTQVQIDTLKYLAALCPDEYGPAVYFARALLSPIDTTNYVSWCEDFGNSRQFDAKRPKSQTLPEQTLNALVYPNPANSILNVELYSQKGQPADLQGKVENIYLYNELGELVLTYKLSNSLTAIPVNSLVNGIYHYRIMDNKQQTIKTDNVLILR